MSALCYKCNGTVDLVAGQDISRSEECQKCFADLRCCMMCEFYDKNSYNECREPIADRVVDKEKSNFCDFFKLSSGENNKTNQKNAALDAANALFKK